MRNKVVFFGDLSDVVGTKEMYLENMSTVHELFRHLLNQYPDLRLKSFKILVNDEEINHERKLEDGDIVVLINPHME